MNCSKETIWHFTCYDCKGWWSIAASDNWKPPLAKGNWTINLYRPVRDQLTDLYCPHCGKNQTNAATLQTLIDENTDILG